MVFANLAYNTNNLAQIKQQARGVGGNQGGQNPAQPPPPPQHPHPTSNSNVPNSDNNGCSPKVSDLTKPRFIDTLRWTKSREAQRHLREFFISCPFLRSRRFGIPLPFDTFFPIHRNIHEPGAVSHISLKLRNLKITQFLPDFFRTCQTDLVTRIPPLRHQCRGAWHPCPPWWTGIPRGPGEITCQDPCPPWAQALAWATAGVPPCPLYRQCQRPRAPFLLWCHEQEQTGTVCICNPLPPPPIICLHL